MAKPLRPKRGTTAKNDAFTGLANEITLDTDKHSIRIHDGVTAGGVAEILPKAKNDELYAPKSGVVTSVNGNTGDITPEQTGCLPLAGGTLTGDLVIHNGYYIKNDVNTGWTRIYGGDNLETGGRIQMAGKDCSGYEGQIWIVPNDGTNAPAFKLFPDGTATWNGRDVITSVGGTFSGALRFANNTAHYVQVDSAGDMLVGGSGSLLRLYAVDNSGNPGGFQIRANDGSTSKYLIAKADGTLQWGGNSLALKPDFTSLVGVTSLPWTAPSDCFVMISVMRNENNSNAGYIRVNNTGVLAFQNVDGKMVGDTTSQFWVKKGDKIEVSGNAKFWRGYYCGGRF